MAKEIKSFMSYPVVSLPVNRVWMNLLLIALSNDIYLILQSSTISQVRVPSERSLSSPVSTLMTGDYRWALNPFESNFCYSLSLHYFLSNRTLKESQKNSGDTSDTTATVIVFILGGVTWSEIRSAYKIMEWYSTRLKIYLGSTHTLKPNGFLQDLAALSQLNAKCSA